MGTLPKELAKKANLSLVDQRKSQSFSGGSEIDAEVFRVAFANGDVYKGGWVDRRQHGKGVMSYSSSTEGENRVMRFEGDWVKGKRHGHGTLSSFCCGELEWRYTGSF